MAILPCDAHTQPSRLILLDGSTAPFESLQIENGILRGAGIPAKLTLDDLRSIEVVIPPRTTDANPTIVAELRGGGRVLAANVTIRDDQCRFGVGRKDPLVLPLDQVRALRLNPASPDPDFRKATLAPAAELDRVFLKDETGKTISVTGLIASLTADQLTLEVNGQSRQLPRAGVFGIGIAQPTASDPAPRVLLNLGDGTLLAGDDLAVVGGQANLSLAGGGSVPLPWADVHHVAIRSRRVVFLSDLKPIEEQEQSLVTLSRPWQRDRAVTGQPLMLGGRSYEKGIGAHSRSRLTFAADRKWDTLAATIGLDSVSGTNGDCVFTVVADGEPLLTRRLRGPDAPEDISVAITGRAQVTLLVEPGEGLDLGDHANWGDVRLVKNRE